MIIAREIITIDCEWDEGELRAMNLMLGSTPIPWKRDGMKLINQADALAKAAGDWKIKQLRVKVEEP